MAGRRLVYLAVLEGCLIFYVAYREWFAWLLLMAVAALPWFSLLVSLPAMLLAKVCLQCPERVEMGVPVQPRLSVSCKLPVMPVRCKLQAIHTLTGSTQRLKAGASLDTAHCGRMEISARRVWAYDYLGLLRLPKKAAPCHVTVFPRSVAMDAPPSLQRRADSSLQPKPGGGFAEHHDLRLYRPGDDLRSIHWKLSSKTGKLIFREPLVPRPGRMLLTMCLHGEPAALDAAFGRLLWLSRYLLEKGLPHEIRCLSGRGLESHPVRTEQDLTAALTDLLGAPPAPQALVPDAPAGAWRCHIGGEPDES